jgi:hypothetical protein
MTTTQKPKADIIKGRLHDSSCDSTRELAFDSMVRRGLKDSAEQRTISNEEMERRIKTWQKHPVR